MTTSRVSICIPSLLLSGNLGFQNTICDMERYTQIGYTRRWNVSFLNNNLQVNGMPRQSSGKINECGEPYRNCVVFIFLEIWDALGCYDNIGGVSIPFLLPLLKGKLASQNTNLQERSTCVGDRVKIVLFSYS